MLPVDAHLAKLVDTAELQRLSLRGRIAASPTA
jgi:hypothetical protein